MAQKNIGSRLEKYDPMWIHVCSQKVAVDSQVLVECLTTWNPNRMPLQIRVANDIWSDFRFFQKRKQAQCMYPLTSLLTGTHGSVVAWSAEGCHRLGNSAIKEVKNGKIIQQKEKNMEIPI